MFAPSPILPGGVHGSNGAPLRLSLVMIVRDRAAVLEPCLKSIRPWVDEMVVVDTGSTDDTVAVARRYGSRVFHFPWCDDFSAARNESLQHARGHWLFWMDSDDTIDEENGRRLRSLADGPHQEHVLAYVMRTYCPGGGEEGKDDVTVVDHVKMFRNLPQIRFEGRIHEQVLPSVRALGGGVTRADIHVVHSGADHTPEGRKHKIERDLRILALDLADRPDHPFVLFNFGMTYSDIGEHEKAVESLEKSLQFSQPMDSTVPKAFALLINSLSMLDRNEEAWRACRRARELHPQDPELSFREALLLAKANRHEEAIAAYRGALQDDNPRLLSSMDRGILGHKTRNNMAATYCEMGRPDLAELQWRLALEERPGWRSGVRMLGDVLVAQGKRTTAEVFAARLSEQPRFRNEAALIHAKIAKAAEDFDDAKQWLEQAVELSEDKGEKLDILCTFLFEQQLWDDLEERLLELLDLNPESRATHHNLGAVYHRLGRLPEAEESLRESLRLRPGSRITWEQLAEVLRCRGDESGADHSMAKAQECRQ